MYMTFIECLYPMLTSQYSIGPAMKYLHVTCTILDGLAQLVADQTSANSTTLLIHTP